MAAMDAPNLATPRLRRRHHYSYLHYVTIEIDSPNVKHEFIDGEIYAMAGGTEDHSGLSGEMIRALGNALVDQPCRVHSSDLRIHAKAPNVSTFPDASVVCGPLQQYAEGLNATALNPTVLVEVTSDSSEEYDTGEKFEFYRTIPSLRDYIVVSHRERRITVHSRGEGAEWMTRVANAGERVAVPSVRVELVVDDIYLKTSIR